MAKQTGPLKYVGTIGDIRHFKIKGQKGHFAGMKGGPTADQVKNGDEFKRTRENMSEFAACARAGKSIRVALSELLKNMADRQLTGRLTAIMKQINLEDGSEARGQRAVNITDAPHYLEGLNFNKNIPFNSIYRGDYSVAAAPARNASTLTVPAFNPANTIQMPGGATHFRLVHALATVANLVYNEDTRAYEPAEPAQNELSAVGYSDYLLAGNQVAGFTIDAALPGAPAISGDVAVLLCVGIEFYQKVGPNYYLLSSGNCLMIETVA
jgi:hypothetical protein